MRRATGYVGEAVSALVLSFVTACVVPPGTGTQRSGAASRDAGGDGAVTGECPSVECAPLECGAGLMPYPLPGECCPTLCIPDDCSTADCPPLECPDGTKAASVKGSCCKRCVTSSAGSGTCDEGQSGYASFLARLLSSQEASSCDRDGDCRLVSLDNACGATCGTALTVRGAAAVTSSANTYADEHCGACPAPVPCPPVERFAICSGGVCTAY